MKKLLLLVAFALCCATTILAQNNNKISYQAVVRDAQNKLVANQPVTVTVSIFNGNTTPAAYSETQTATTNLNGLISLLIGPDGSDFGWNSIEWNNAHVETTVKLNGNTLGTLEMPFTAVPYAMYAEYADSVNVNVIANYLTSHYIPSGSVETVQSDWKQTNPQAADYIKNKPTKLTDFTNDGNFVQDANYTHIDNNYTNDEKTKLAGIEAGAEVNVKSNWTETDQNSDAFILNKPENLVQDNSYVHTDNNYTAAEKTKLAGIETGAEVNVKSNWTETDQNSDAFILNKPENLVQDNSYVHTDNNYTAAEKTKLEGIEAEAEKNVQSNWSETDQNSDAFILNKPENLVQDNSYVHTDNNYTAAEKTKLEGIEAEAEKNVQSNWSETDQNSDAFILNKPENLVQDNSYVHTDNNYTAAEKTKLEGIEAEAEKNVQSNWSETDQNSDAFILNKPENLAYTDADNAFSGSNTFTGNNTFGGDNTTTTFNGAVNFSGAVNASSVSFTCGTTTSDLCTLLNGLQNTISNLQSEINTLKNDKARIDSLANVTDSLANVTKNMPMMGQETFTLTAERASSGEFQLQHAPKTSYIYRMYINGVMVGGSNTGVLTLKENTTDTLKYDASKNGNTSLEEGFKVTIVYWYLPEESTSVIPSGN